jgi:hypothetical protein
MQNLGQLTDWTKLDAGEALFVQATASQKVTIRLNSAYEVALMYWPLKSDGTYDRKQAGTLLARVSGLDELRFLTPLPLAIEASGEVMVCTTADMTVQPNEATESFTRIVERRSVDPALAEIISRFSQNQRQMARQMNEIIGNQQAEYTRREASRLRLEKKEKADVDNLTKGDKSDAGKAGKHKPALDVGTSSDTAPKRGEGDVSSAKPV